MLQRIKLGDQGASEELLPLVYSELRKIAAARMSREKPGQTLQGTALVHEAWIRLAGSPSDAAWNDRGAFFAAASEAMRRILVDIARRKSSVKHGGMHTRRVFTEQEISSSVMAEEVVAVSDVLERLQEKDPEAAELVKLHYFGGLSLEEAGKLLNVSRATAYRTWTFARAFLRAEIQGE
ncbi:MAG: sigma-70 family RNA polymerase sigma factor [Planctomycetaceae bacterium]|nr:sigma-70 family RNA polymerase sigma factor [Planctomycetaceae bacterium]